MTAFERIVEHLRLEEGHEQTTAEGIALNTLRKWSSTGTDHLGRALGDSVREAATLELTNASRRRNDRLTEAQARGIATVKAGGVTMKKSSRRTLSEKAKHRATIAEGILSATNGVVSDLAFKSANTLLGNPGFATPEELKAALHEELRIDWFLTEALGYAKTPIRGQGGKFHGMHGREKASKTGATVPGAGTATCGACGALKPSESATCPSCQAEQPPPEPETAEAAPEQVEEAVAAGTTIERPAAPAKPAKAAPKAAGAANAEPPASASAPAAPKGRDGEAARDPEFEKQHPRAPKGRTGGGQWIAKGTGTAKQPSPVVAQLQQRLSQLGFQLKDDGQFGDITEQNLKMFQRKYGLPETGELDPSTVETLRNPPPKSALEVQREEAEATAEMEKNGGGSGGSGGGSDGESGGGAEASFPDPTDEEAIKRWQEAHGLKPSGVIDKVTQAAMRALKKAGSSGANGDGSGVSKPKDGTGGGQLIRRGDGMMGETDADVEKYQQMLDKLGFDLGSGGVDGMFGEDTEAAIRKFQQRYGLRVDGVLGPQTQELLERLWREGRSTADTITEGSYSGVGVGGSWGTYSHHGGASAPVAATDNVMSAAHLTGEMVADQGPVLHFDPQVTREARMELRLAEAIRERDEARENGDGSAWNRANARVLHLQSQLREATDSRSLPDIPNKKGKTNWVEKAGGLPKYIERIAKHLRSEKGMDTGRAIATAVNVVKKMCASGDTNFPGKQNVNAGSRAQACKAVAEWEAKKARHSAEQPADIAPALQLIEALEEPPPIPTFEQAFNIARDMETAEVRRGKSYLDD